MSDTEAEVRRPAAPRVLGQLREFDPEVDNICTYLERMELYFDVNAVETRRQVPVLLTVIGAKAYETLRSLFAPTLPREKTFDELIQALKQHFNPKPLVIGERFRFYRRSQLENETVVKFLTDLRRLSIRCEFGDFLDQALRDRFVCGVTSTAIQKRLLAEDGLTSARALEMAQGIEAAESNSKELKAERQIAGLNFAGGSENGQRSERRCYRCGGRNHEPMVCKFKNAKCHNCQNTGHIASACRSEPKRQTAPERSSYKSGGKRRPRSHKWLGTQESSEESSPESMDPANSLFTVRGDSHPPIMVRMKLNKTNVDFELDTGATVTVMSETTFRKLFPKLKLARSGMGLTTYTGEPMKIVGEAIIKDVRYQKQRGHSLSIIVVQGTGPPLLGRNWLCHFRLNWNRIKTVVIEPNALTTLEKEFPEVFSDGLGTVKHSKAKLSVTSDAKPRFYRPRPVPYSLKAGVEKELERLEQAGVIEKVDYSEWAAPIVTVPKSDGQLRICGDYSVTVNPVLEVDQYPLPRPEDLFATLAGGKKFSTLDLKHAYNQIEVDEDSQKYLTVNTQKGLFKYKRLPFGVSSAPAVFQRTMDKILQGLDGVICYVDDLLITGKTDEEHFENLRKVLTRLRENGIKIKKSKCHIGKSMVKYLGHKIDAEGIHATDEKIKAISKAPSPKNLTELRSFLGLLNYYGRFIRNLSTLLHPLNQLMKHDCKWKWTEECETAFTKAKEQITSSKVLVHYDCTLPLKLAGDASNYGIGAVISHVMSDGSERPIAFASRTLLPSEKNYAQIEKEALSLVFGLAKFHTYLYGRKFVLVTDHKPLTTIFGHKKGIPAVAAARLTRWALKLSAYNYQIEFRPTGEHANADALSRLPLATISSVGHSQESALYNLNQIESLPVTSSQLAMATRNDPSLSKLYRFITQGWPGKVDTRFKPFLHRKNELTVESGCILWGTRVVVPLKWQDKLLSQLHSDHLGIVKMKSVARSYIWWPGLDKSIEQLANSCVDCQAVKNSPPVAPLQPWSWPSRVFERIHIDFAGPFQGTMFLIMVDAYSKWPEVTIMRSTTVEKTIEALRSVFASCGLPERLVSDNGPQFTSQEFAIFLKANGIKHSRSAPYHPSTNGLAERFVQSMKQALKASLRTEKSLHQRLCSFLLSYRSTVHSTTGVTPSSLFLKREMRTQFDLLKPDIKTHVAEKQARQKQDHDKHAKARLFEVGDAVMAKNLRPGPDWVKAIVISKLGPLSCLVETEDKLLWRRHVDHLKKLDVRPIRVPEAQEAVSVVDDPEDEVMEMQQDGPELTFDSQSDASPPPLSVPDPIPDSSAPSTVDNTSRYSLRSGTLPPDYYRPLVN